MTGLPTAVIARLTLPAQRTVDGGAGTRKGRRAGPGTELLTTRPYEHGDDTRFIDAHATARTGVLHVTSNVADVAAPVHVVIDASSSMRFGPKTAKWQAATECADLIIRIAGRSQERTTLHIAGNGQQPERLPAGSLRATARLARAAASAPPWGQSGTLAFTLESLASRKWPPGIVMVLTDPFISDVEVDALKRAGSRHAVTVVEVHDPRELELGAAGRVRLTCAETGRVAIVDTSDARNRNRYADAVAARRDTVRSDLLAHGVHVMPVSTREDVSAQLAGQLPRK